MSGVGLFCDHWPGPEAAGSWRRPTERSARSTIQGMLRRASETAQRLKGANLALVLGKIRRSFYSSSYEGQQRLHMHTDMQQRAVGTTRAGLLMNSMSLAVGGGDMGACNRSGWSRGSTWPGLANLRVTIEVKERTLVLFIACHIDFASTSQVRARAVSASRSLYARAW